MTDMTCRPVMSDEDFLRAFEACAIDAGDFRHADHVRLAWIYLQRHPLLEAIERFRDSLQRFAAHHGVPGRYHETITWAYLLLIHERMQRGDGAGDWDRFRAVHADLLQWKPSILERYYTRETLLSDIARRTFVLPDMAARRTARLGGA
jgi:hypothetical protein